MSGRQSSIVDVAIEQVRMGYLPLHVAKTLGIAVSTIYRALRRERERMGNPNALRKRDKEIA